MALIPLILSFLSYFLSVLRILRGEFLPSNKGQDQFNILNNS